jgi:polyribonucleotide nucleotidyltransferase
MSNSKIIKKTVVYGDHELTLETGKVARQAAGSVMVSMGKTRVLATATVGAELPNAGFMPLTTHYQERFYAAGRIPGGFFRREGRPTEKETLMSRLIDRPLRPLFASGFKHEVLVTCTVMSLDPDYDGDIPAMVGASAALSLARIPWAGPVGGARVGYVDGNYCLNTSRSTVVGEHPENDVKNRLDMIIAGTQDAVLMVESEADGLNEEQMLGAVSYAHKSMQPVIKAINEMVAESGKQEFVWKPPVSDDTLMKQIADDMAEPLVKAYGISEKSERAAEIARIRRDAVAKYSSESLSPEEVQTAFHSAEKQLVRSRILDGKPRIGGRDLKTVRPIQTELGVMPCTHGSAIFTRGETQAIGTVTLGTLRDAQMIDLPEGKSDDTFMLHYNFPPYSVGEAGRMGPPGRREMGHGRLARRSIAAVLPGQEEFPYVTRVVSEITESNGSSSMASVCVASLALMDAGVPIKEPVAGVAMGLVKEGDRYAVLTDILGDEDHLGDMDFKVAGSKNGVNALQMDIKIQGIDEEIMKKALEQAREARLHILDEMSKCIEQPRESVADHAPGWKVITIPVDKIRTVIGKGGETIRSITADTDTNIDVEQDGKVHIYGAKRSSIDDAVERIKGMTTDIEVGARIRGEVMRITDFGAFVNVQPGKDGLVHISQVADHRIEKVSDYLTEGEMVDVKVIGVDEQNRINLSIKALAEDE